MTMKRVLFTCFVLLVFVGTAHATLYSGSLTTGTNTLLAFGAWSGDTISVAWDVDDTTNPGYWSYNYTLTGFAGPSISHGIFEVSSNFTSDNIKEGTSGDRELGTFGPSQGGSNPGIPGSIFGIKFNTGDEGTINITIVSDREPMWGDFYGKGGDASYAYNSGFGFDTFAPIGSGNALSDGKAWALVPDTNPVPEPSTMLLLGLGVMGIAAAGRRKRSNKV